MKESKRSRRFGLPLLALILLFTATVISFFIRQSEVMAAKKEVENLEHQIEYYKATKEALLEQKEILATDDYIEKIAREKLGLVMPGEMQYMLLEGE